MRVSVIGSGDVDGSILQAAERVGEQLGERSHTLVCGGLGGVMAAACAGAKRAGGRTIGILPGTDEATANPYVDEAIVTGLGEARNVLVVMNGSGVIAIDGAYGTLSEIAFALKWGRPVAGIDTHAIEGVRQVGSAEEAVAYLERSDPSAESAHGG